MSETLTVDNRTTPFAILAALILVVPGWFLGGLVVLVYMFFTNLGMARFEGGSWIPFLDGIFNFVWLYLIPEIIRGAVGVAAALGLTFLIFKRTNREVVCYTVVTVYLLIGGGLIAFAWLVDGFHRDMVGIAVEMIGMVIGAISAYQYERQSIS